MHISAHGVAVVGPREQVTEAADDMGLGEQFGEEFA
jgi:hypothetical protein